MHNIANRGIKLLLQSLFASYYGPVVQWIERKFPKL